MAAPHVACCNDCIFVGRPSTGAEWQRLMLHVVMTVFVDMPSTGAERQHLTLHVAMTVSLWAGPALVLNGSASCCCWDSSSSTSTEQISSHDKSAASASVLPGQHPDMQQLDSTGKSPLFSTDLPAIAPGTVLGEESAQTFAVVILMGTVWVNAEMCIWKVYVCPELPCLRGSYWGTDILTSLERPAIFVFHFLTMKACSQSLQSTDLHVSLDKLRQRYIQLLGFQPVMVVILIPSFRPFVSGSNK